MRKPYNIPTIAVFFSHFLMRQCSFPCRTSSVRRYPRANGRYRPIADTGEALHASDSAEFRPQVPMPRERGHHWVLSVPLGEWHSTPGPKL